jgi:hypothetical protein
MEIGEVTAYSTAWKTGGVWVLPPNPIDINYVTRAGYLWRKGEDYYYNSNFIPPVCWILVSQPELAPESSLKIVANTDLGSTAARSLPSTFSPPTALTVSIQVVPDSNVSVYAIEDIPPAGWTVSAIDNGGVLDTANSQVKWGPFFDDSARTVTYQATPSAVTTGLQTFVGTASFDGVGLAIGGATTINPAAYVAWKDNVFTPVQLADSASSGDFADPANDGIPNLLKYALALDPNSNGLYGLPTVAIVNGFLTLNYRQNKLASDIIFTVEACSLPGDGSWSTNGLWEVSCNDCNIWWSVTVSDSVAVTNTNSRFMHLSITGP